MGLRFLIPSLLLAALIADVALRFVPPDRIYFRAWEPAKLFATADGPFAPNFHYDNDRTYGDLSNLGNRPRFRQYHREIFTTDEFGYRNPPRGGTGEMPAVILVGDSYAVGCGVSDADTLSAQLMSRLPGRRVYNGASEHPTWNMTSKLIQRMHMQGGLVIWEVSERTPLPKSVSEETSEIPGVVPMITPPSNESYRVLQDLDHWTDIQLTYSPLRIFLSRGFREMENGVWLPNPSGKVVLVGQLRNGDSMLFHRSEVDNFYRPQYDIGDYLSEISALVHGSGNELLVLLVPDKYGVYYPFLREAGQSPPEGQSRLDYLEKNLHRSGVPVLNLMSPLRSQAAEGLQRREYNYAIDDTHWNHLGIQTAVGEVLRAESNYVGFSSSTSIGRNTSAVLQ
jgi:SGNH hydrolase-like domain, acetyltransferase AlgX